MHSYDIKLLYTQKKGIMRLDNHKLMTVKYKFVFLTYNGKKQQFLTVDEVFDG